MRKKLEPWEKSVPIDLRPAIKHLRERFRNHRARCDRTTGLYCYALLHDSTFNDPEGESREYLQEMRAAVGLIKVRRFDAMLSTKRPSAIFKAFYDLDIEVVGQLAMGLQQQIIEVGRANQNRLKEPYIAWAEDQTRQLIDVHRRGIMAWVCRVCDGDALTEDEIFGDTSEWKWLAPRFLAMEPSGQNSWNESSAWERVDRETTQGWLNWLADDYVLSLEVKIRELSGETAVRMANTTPAVEAEPASPTAPVPVPAPKQASARELGKLNTQARYRLWQKEYRKLKKKHPLRSDNWCARQIRKLDCGGDLSVDTIRRHMVKK